MRGRASLGRSWCGRGRKENEGFEDEAAEDEVLKDEAKEDEFPQAQEGEYGVSPRTCSLPSRSHVETDGDSSEDKYGVRSPKFIWIGSQVKNLEGLIR